MSKDIVRCKWVNLFGSVLEDCLRVKSLGKLSAFASELFRLNPLRYGNSFDSRLLLVTEKERNRLNEQTILKETDPDQFLKSLSGWTSNLKQFFSLLKFIWKHDLSQK